MPQGDYTIALPAPHRAGWAFMLLVSLAVVALGGGMLVTHRHVLQTESLAGGFALLGTGLFLACFALLMLFSRKPAAHLIVDAQARQLRLVDGNGGEVDVPGDSLVRALVPMNPSDGRGHVVALEKRDGGLLELCMVAAEQDAEALAGEITEAIAALQAKREQAWSAANWGDPKTLPKMAGVKAERRDDDMLLSWAIGSSLGGLVGAGCPLGLGLVGIAAVREGGGLGAKLFAGFCFTLALLILASVLVSQGGRVLVTLSAADVTVERTRFGFAAGMERLALSQITAVDYAHQLNASGNGLSLRTSKLDAPLQELGDAATPKDAFSAALKLMQGIGAGITIPCGRLPLASKVALDMLLSAEVGRRTSRMPSEL